jgi:DNA-binding transcriptional LysR family regulator
MDQLTSWRVFLTVANRRSFVQAARVHRRSPQAITRAVAQLEEHLGTRLLHRTTRSVSLTDDGARYVERIATLLADFDALEASLTTASEPSGTVVVAAPVVFGELHVAPVVHEFLREHLGVSVRLDLFDRVVSMADEGVDVAIRIGSLPDSALRARQLGEVRRVTCAAPAYLKRAGIPRTPSALSRHECITFSGTAPAADVWSFAQRSVRVRPRLSVNSARAAIDAALAGMGITRVLSYQVAAQLRTGRLRAVLARFDREAAPVQLLQLPRPPTRAAAAFADFASERLRRSLTQVAVAGGSGVARAPRSSADRSTSRP